MVTQTLALLNTWYNEPSQGGDRPKLLAKLAVIELCGWIEEQFDQLVVDAATATLKDADWVRRELIAKTSGFTYGDHLRPMLTKLIGEVLVRRVEADLESKWPGEIEILKSMLGTLWKMRCGYAHADMTANVASQQVFNAPSWVSNQQRILVRLIGRYTASMNAVLATL